MRKCLPGVRQTPLSERLYATAIDLADSHVAIDGGLHIAALGGVWLTAVFGFAGLSMRDDGVALDPQLPAGWRTLGFKLQWRGRQLKVRLEYAEQNLDATLEAGEPMALFVSGERHELHCDRMFQVPFGKPVDRGVVTGNPRGEPADWNLARGAISPARDVELSTHL